MAGINDPLTFVKAETYFERAAGWGGPTKLVSINDKPPSTAPEPTFWHGVNLKFDDGTFAVVQFIRPTLFRVRYDPTVKDQEEYDDASSHIIIGEYTSVLVKDLDEHRGLVWGTTLARSSSGKHWVFESKVTDVKKKGGSHYKKHDGMKIHIYENPFRIQAVRETLPHPDLYEIPDVPPHTERKAKKVVWQTSPKTFRYSLDAVLKPIKNVVLDIIKAGQGEFIGFGEQGGMSFMKKPLFMNYFNFDNMQYQQVYNKGPLDAREPLYHSDPFWLDVNSNPEHKNVTANFLDNYSQIAIDFGMTNSGYIKVGTRFGQMDMYIISADTVPEIVRLYTGIVGRPKLKPRFILGNHQACYGYEKEEDLSAVVSQYRDSKFPIDGLHIDVDFQDGFRTFTTNPRTFPNAQRLLHEFKDNGIKCSTNITPVISINDRPERPDGYSTLREGLEKGYFILDTRYKDGTSGRAEDVRYACYGGGNLYEVDPNDKSQRPDFIDNYDFPANFDSGYPYHGAVSYGYGNGTAGYYPDLNRAEVREWWGKQYQHLYDTGLEFVWQDMTTPAIHTSYGDMKALPNRLIVNADPVSGKRELKKQLAIEQWALYSYNLHKATARGLDNLPGREGKRNFILGRGSFAGAYRYAGLWTGDNASTWDFWKITISQVLSVGLNGVTIAGSDTGGFEPSKDSNNQEERYCSPELLIRWYSGSFLLPWLRNHYVKKTRKWFQEPYAYPKHLESHPELEPLAWLYHAVERVSKYYVELRYSLIQVLYDAMFANQIHGLPIARSMLLTDVADSSFFNETQHFLDDQYMAGNDILVAPIIHPKSENPSESRQVYLPLTNFWYNSNLRPWDDQGTPLLPRVEGGRIINFTAKITNNYDDFPYVVPVYVREGSIIPQLRVTQYVGDVSEGPNRVKYNVYPGKDHSYTTYLDDGVSRSSAPTDSIRYKLVTKKKKGVKAKKDKKGEALNEEIKVDEEAKGEFREVLLAQTTVNGVRTLTITKKHDNYNPVRELGTYYTVIFWYDVDTTVENYQVEVSGGAEVKYDVYKRNDLRTVTLDIHETVGTTDALVVKVTPA